MRAITECDLEFARYAASQTSQLSRLMNFEERVAIGLVGLVQASRDHDPEKSAWKTYAINRARFAILDESRVRGGRKGQKSAPTCSIEEVGERTAADGRNWIESKGEEVDTFTDTVEGLARKLPSREAEAFRLYWIHGLKLREIASRLGVTEGRVGQLTSRAHARLRELITPEFFAKGGAA